jgi:hypothetical protein
LFSQLPEQQLVFGSPPKVWQFGAPFGKQQRPFWQAAVWVQQSHASVQPKDRSTTQQTASWLQAVTAQTGSPQQRAANPSGQDAPNSLHRQRFLPFFPLHSLLQHCECRLHFRPSFLHAAATSPRSTVSPPAVTAASSERRVKRREETVLTATVQASKRRASISRLPRRGENPRPGGGLWSGGRGGE